MNLLLAPGSGSDRNHPLLIALEAATRPRSCSRMDFPYCKAGRKLPDRLPVAIAAVLEEAQLLGELSPDRLVLGGRSFGGRMCSLAVAEGLTAAGLVLLSYPLHPPGKPARLRTEHFPALTVPCLFISGLKDPFGTPAEFERELAAIPGPVTQVWVKGGHDPANHPQIARTVVDWMNRL